MEDGPPDATDIQKNKFWLFHVSLVNLTRLSYIPSVLPSGNHKELQRPCRAFLGDEVAFCKKMARV